MPDVVRARELGLAAPHPARVPRPAAQRGAAQRRGRRHQRQVDRDRDDRLDPPRLPPPADGDERRGDEEFRHARPRRSRARWSAIPELFVSEVDESDGSIALYKPEIAVLTNISLDHKEMDELRQLVRRASCCARARRCSTSTIPRRARSPTPSRPSKLHRLRLRQPGRGLHGQEPRARCRTAAASRSMPRAKRARCGSTCPAATMRPTRWRRIAATRALGVPLEEAAAALARFEGLKRRLETVGTAGGVTVIDDFAHNPDKIDATLATLRAQPGRLLIMFQPHGYGPLAKMGEELAESFAERHGAGRPALSARSGLPGRDGRADARLRLAGRSRFAQRGGKPSISPSAPRSARPCSPRRAPGDRIVIMGARDDTLSDFAARAGRAARGTELKRALRRRAAMAKPGTVTGWKLVAGRARGAAASASRPNTRRSSPTM